MKKIMITGGSGFIGSALIRHVIKNTNDTVMNIDINTYASSKDSLLSVEGNERYFFKKINICDQAKVKEIFKEFKPDIIMHLAAESHVDRSIKSPIDFINTNIIGTFILLEEFRFYYYNQNKNSIFHHISTDEVFGDLNDKDDYFVEDTPYDPSSPYSASKASSDHLARSWSRTYDLPIVITNCSNNYGPFQFPEKLIPLMIFNAINKKDLSIYGDGSAIRDWLYVDDHVKALYKIVTNFKEGCETYVIGGMNQKTNIEVVNEICSILDTLKPNKDSSSYKDQIVFIKDRPGHDKKYAIDPAKINNKFGWKPEESFESGLLKTIKWYMDNLSWVEKVIK
jgi:dTDP-glucose 4,6-dehydratase